MLTEPQRLRYRLSLLMQMQEALPHGLQLAALIKGQIDFGFRDTTVNECLIELNALVEMGHAGAGGAGVNAALKHHKLTENGRVALVDAGWL